jgi:hypothetical protein
MDTRIIKEYDWSTASVIFIIYINGTLEIIQEYRCVDSSFNELIAY